MNKDLEDKLRGSHTTSRGQTEIDAWDDLVIQVELHDNFWSDMYWRVTKKKYSWDNQRRGHDMVCTRLGRFYITTNLLQLKGQNRIWHTLLHILDQAPVFLKLKNNKNSIRKTPPFNRQLFKKEDTKASLIEVWKTSITASEYQS